MLLQNLRYALRAMGKNPGFVAVALLTLGLGIGANVAIFSLVNAVLLRPLPYPNPEQLVGLGQWRNQQGEGYIQTGVSAPNVADIARSGLFQQVAYYRWGGFNITEGNRPESVDSIKASAELLPMFGIAPEIGRFFHGDETEAGRDKVAVIGHRLWQERYRSDAGILGKTIELDREKYTIIGVMPASFRFTWDQEMDVFVPLVLTDEERSEVGRGTSRDLQTQARLSANVSVPQAQAAMNTLAAALAAKYPAANRGWGFKVEPLHAAYHRGMQTPLMIMLGAVAMVLLIACANIANLLLARATGRTREMAIRVAIGASRARLTFQLLTESIVLAVSGGMLGIFIGFGANRLLTYALTRSGIRFANARVIDMDWRVVLFALGITLVTGVLFGLAPAWTTARAGAAASLKETGTSTTSDIGRKQLRNGLVVCEMALALILLTVAGLFVRSFVELSNVDLGIDPKNVLTLEISLPDYKYPKPTQQAVFFRQLVEKVESIPGARAVGTLTYGGNVFFQPEGEAPAIPGKEPTAQFKIVSPQLLRAEGTPLLQGRMFDEHDTLTSTPVALVSESVAHRFWPGRNPIGSHVSLISHVYSGQKAAPNGSQSLEIVGIVKDIRSDSLWQAETDIYVPAEQKPSSDAELMLRTMGAAPTSLAGPVRAAVLSLDNEQPVSRVRTMEEVVSQTYGAIRFPMALLWIFSTLALVLSAIGIFGVMSYSVSRRAKEIAIRMALGANRGETLGLILREGLVVSLIGVAIGLVGAFGLSRFVASYLYGVTATDPVTFISAPLILVCVALAASYLPARRATTVDPTVALRYE